MKTAPLSTKPHRARRSAKAALSQYLYDPEAFWQLLRRERMRADRSGATFCVLVFPLRLADGRRHNVTRLAGLLAGRLRLTDQCGFLDDRRVAAFLPETPPAGAAKVLDDLRCLHDRAAPPLLCDTFIYPGNLLPLFGDADNDHPHSRNGHSRWQPVERLFERPTGIWRRLMDLVLGFLILLASLPVMALAALAIKLTSPGPALFSQLRAGRGGRPFRMYKLRTMAVDAETRKAGLLELSEQDGPAFKMKDDPRVTLVGRFLRRTSIDELPQLWNVLRGDMSLVGPRPLPCEEQAECERWQQHRLDINPGLTGVWQVEGRSEVSFDVWMRMDRAHLQRYSLWTDVRLILATIPAVLLRKGAH